MQWRPRRRGCRSHFPRNNGGDVRRHPSAHSSGFLRRASNGASAGWWTSCVSASAGPFSKSRFLRLSASANYGQPQTAVLDGGYNTDEVTEGIKATCSVESTFEQLLSGLWCDKLRQAHSVSCSTNRLFAQESKVFWYLTLLIILVS